MGQQQLLLIVLGVIIVGIAVVVGINLFNANAKESTKDTMISEATNLGAMAQQYYKKPAPLGGGANAFTGFTAPYNLVHTSTADYTFAITPDQVIITGTPKSYDDFTTLTTVQAKPDSMWSSIGGAAPTP